MQTQGSPADFSGFGRTAILLFLALTSLYLLVARGRITSVDEWHVYGTAESLAETGSWTMRVEGLDRKYSRFSVVPSLFGVPFYKVMQPFASGYPAGNAPAGSGQLWQRDFMQAAVSFQTPFVTAATAAVLFWGLGRAGVRPGAALAAALVFALGTLAMPYSGSMYVQPLAGLGLATVVLSAVTSLDLLVCLSLALLLAVRMELVVVLPALLLHVIRFRRPVLAPLAWIMAGSATGVGLNLFVNALRGDALITGDYRGEAFTTPLWIGLNGLFLSSGKGLAWFAPAALAGLALMPWLLGVAPRVGLLVTGTSMTIVVMVASWWTWHGGWSWGPRLLVPVMPLLVLPFAWVFETWHNWPRGGRWFFLCVIAWSVGVQARGVVTDPVGDRSAVWRLLNENENESIYIPQVGPWGVESSAGPDIFWWRLWQCEPRAHVLLAILATVLTCIAGVSAGLVGRSLQLQTGWFRELFPLLRPMEVCAFAAALVVLSVPIILERWLTRGERASATVRRDRLPANLRRLEPDRTGMQLNGRLYIPIKGRYTFYQQGLPGTQFYLDGQALFRDAPPESGVVLDDLDVGFHSLRVEGRAVGHFNPFYWTIPGNARYKEPVPLVYLTGPAVHWKDRFAIGLAHWRWLAWATALIGAAFVCSWPHDARFAPEHDSGNADSTASSIAS